MLVLATTVSSNGAAASADSAQAVINMHHAVVAIEPSNGAAASSSSGATTTVDSPQAVTSKDQSSAAIEHGMGTAVSSLNKAATSDEQHNGPVSCCY